jgi:uncharacterized membrane protein
MATLEAAPAPLKHPISRRLHNDRSPGERLADRIAGQIGSWGFLIIQTVAVALWIALNGVGLALGWDPYPFALLNLLFSVQAAYTGPILLLSQNRSAQRDRIMAEHDYATNERSERLIEALLGELLRNSQATLAIAGFHGIELEALERQEDELAAKIDLVRDQLTAVGQALTEQPPAARGRAAGAVSAAHDRMAPHRMAHDRIAEEVDVATSALPEERRPPG